MSQTYGFTLRLRTALALCLSVVAAACGDSGAGEPSAKLGEDRQELTSSNLPGGTSIEVNVDNPSNGAVLPPGPVTVDCTGQIGLGVPVANTQITYVVDVSGSTAATGGCGGDQNGDGSSNTVLDCEIAATVATNAQAITTGTVAEVGVAVLGTNAAAADVGPAAGTQLLTGPATDADAAGGRDVEQVLRSARQGQVGVFTFHSVGTGTNFNAGVASALSVAAASSKPNKIAVFVSDGLATVTAATLASITSSGVKFYTFAVGAGSSCAGSLQSIANAAGGTCTHVTDLSTLPDVIPGVIASQLTGLTATVDAQPVSLTLSQTLPQNGPTSATGNGTSTSLSPGSHTVCCTANGTDGGGSGSVTDCSTIRINAPPVALCKDVTVSADAACVAGASIDNGSSDPDGDAFSCVQVPAGPYAQGTTTVTLVCTDAYGATGSCTSTVTVLDSTPPAITCPASQTLECTGGGAVATFNATATDNCSTPTVACVPPSGSTFPLGSTNDTCTATDASGNASSCNFTVTVQDTTPPVVTTIGHPLSLWPPNHDYHPFSLSDCVTSVVDRCQGTLDISAAGKITRITSDEAEDVNGPGDGNTCDDAVITGDTTANLRAERNNNSDGRVYTIYFDVRDAAGNTTASSCQVQVVKDQSGPDAVAVDSGCQFCTGTGCGACPTSSPPLCP